MKSGKEITKEYAMQLFELTCKGSLERAMECNKLKKTSLSEKIEFERWQRANEALENAMKLLHFEIEDKISKYLGLES